MLRLRPSEITLTPIDVEETHRRMSHKQQAAPPAVLSSLSSYPPRGPRLRRGPVRSRDAAVHHLGNIPVLTPHQVIHTSTDAEPADGQLDDAGDGSRERSRVDGLSDAASSPDAPDAHAEQFTSSPSLVRGLQLPIRPAPSGDAGRTRLASRENTDVEAASASNQPLGPPTPPQNKASTSEALSTDPVDAHLQGSTDGTADVSHGHTLNTNSSSQTQAANGQGVVASPARRHAQAVSESGQPLSQSQTRQGNSGSKALPTLLLQGFYVSPGNYTFKESFMMPHTEPRKPSGRFASKTRTMSCSSEPPQSISQMNPRRHDPRQPGDVFWSTVPAKPVSPTEQDTKEADGQPESSKARSSFEERIRRVHTRLELIQGRTRGFFGRSRDGRTDQNTDEHLAPSTHPNSSERISEASSSSLPYSYYELPASRHSSREGSHSQELPQSQYDGAAPSRQSARGAYFSIRPSQVHVKNDVARPQLTRVSSFSSPDLTSMLGQHGLSPRPASPYTRQESTQNTQSATRTPSVLITPDDFVGPDRDAASAAARDLSSPLDLLAQRAYVQLAQAPSLFPAAPQYQGPGITSVFQYQVQDFDSEQRRTRQSGVGTMRQESGNSAHYRMQTGRHPGDMHRRHERSSTNTSEPQTYRRAVQGGRAGQRSSENVPVGVPPSHALPPPRVSHVQAHRVSFGNTQRPRTSQGISLRGGEAPPLPAPIRFSAPRQYAPSTRDGPHRGPGPPPTRAAGRRINRSIDGSNNMVSSSPGPGPPINPSIRRSSQRYAQGTTNARVRRSVTSSGTHSSDSEGVLRRYPPPHTGEVPPRSHFDRHSQLRGPAGHHHHQHYPAVGLTSLQHANTRRPPIPARVASRRVSARQRNQENEGEVEAELMREELGQVGMRYGGEGGGGEVMDETPPRIGRFERRMLEN